jgi:hypothetical protein
MKTSILMIVLAACVSAVATPAVAVPVDSVCTVDAVAAYANRIHIHCSRLGTGLGFTPPLYLAVEANSPLATQALIIATRALSTPDHQLGVTWENQISSNPPGCLATDCRRLLGVSASP